MKSLFLLFLLAAPTSFLYAKEQQYPVPDVECIAKHATVFSYNKGPHTEYNVVGREKIRSNGDLYWWNKEKNKYIKHQDRVIPVRPIGGNTSPVYIAGSHLFKFEDSSFRRLISVGGENISGQVVMYECINLN